MTAEKKKKTEGIVELRNQFGISFLLRPGLSKSWPISILEMLFLVGFSQQIVPKVDLW